MLADVRVPVEVVKHVVATALRLRLGGQLLLNVGVAV
jgi:hypothetical protein